MAYEIFFGSVEVAEHMLSAVPDDTALVFEAGFARQKGIMHALRKTMPRRDSALTFDAVGNENQRDYPPEEAAQELATGGMWHAQWTSDDPHIQWVEIYGPHHQPVSPTPWLLSFEYRGKDWEEVFDELVSHSDCVFGVVSIEESLEGGPELNDPDEFPWDDWRLVMAAVGTPESERRVRRRGPAYSRVA